jgi:hypothetical protein
MKVMELIEHLSSLPQNLEVLAVDCNGNSTSYVMIKNLIGHVEITGFPEPKPYDTHNYDDLIMPGPYNGDFLEEDGK